MLVMNFNDVTAFLHANLLKIIIIHQKIRLFWSFWLFCST